MPDENTIFHFIDDEKLRIELEKELDFVKFILDSAANNVDNCESESLKNVIVLMIQKDVLIKLWCITEAILFHVARKINLSSSELKWKKQTDKRVLYEIQEWKRLISQIEIDVYLDPETIEFRSVIEAFSRLNWFPEWMKDMLHRMRKMRNWVHIHDFVMDSEDFQNNNIEKSITDLMNIIKYCKGLL